MIIFMSGALYHAVEKWEPMTQREEHGDLTPGRVSTVFFFPKKSYDALKDKPELWHIDTVGGRFPHALGKDEGKD